MKEGIIMKNYVNAKAEIYKLDAGDVMLVASTNLDFENIDTNESKAYSTWGDWNSNS